jgi:hypothetical protein
MPLAESIIIKLSMRWIDIRVKYNKFTAGCEQQEPGIKEKQKKTLLWSLKRLWGKREQRRARLGGAAKE